jgi:hypothetical protein
MEIQNNPTPVNFRKLDNRTFSKKINGEVSTVGRRSGSTSYSNETCTNNFSKQISMNSRSWKNKN